MLFVYVSIIILVAIIIVDWLFVSIRFVVVEIIIILRGGIIGTVVIFFVVRICLLINNSSRFPPDVMVLYILSLMLELSFGFNFDR